MARKFTVKLTGSPDNMLAKVRAAVKEGGGSFDGDATSGTFAGSGVTGKYSVSGTDIVVTIQKKPFVIPGFLIESKVREFFA